MLPDDPKNLTAVAYRRFGTHGAAPPTFDQLCTGSMGYWDPAVIAGPAKGRGVILFHNAGVSNSSGETPTTFRTCGANAVAFIRALRRT